MSQVRQVSLLAAGCQPWNIDVCTASGDRFAYCATLAIYIYQLDTTYNEFKLHSIMSEHKKTITTICWHPRDHDLLASAGADRQVLIWHVSDQRVVHKLEKLKEIPICLGWNLQEQNIIGMVAGRGPLYLWNYSTNGGALTFHKDAQSFSSDVCQFRWHPKQLGKIVFGHKDGSVSIFCPGKRPHKHVLKPEDEDSGDEGEDAVLCLEWDPLSTEYLLIARNQHGICMVDADALNVIQRFSLPSAAAMVHTLAWINNAPGMFITGDTNTGVMRIWTVAKSTPLENLKLKKTGFHALHVFTTTPGRSDSGGQNMGYQMPTLSPAGRYALPPAYAVCTFLDGGVGLYDLGKRRWYFLRDQGHIETIFDCKFKPESSDYLATASFDGTIKIWDVNSLSPINCSPGNEGVIYSLSWAPADLDCVVASTAKNGAFIWDLQKNKIIKRYKEHGSHAIFCVSWNQKDSRRIATSGGDGFCIVRQVDGLVLARFKHPASCFGCDWNPNNKDMIATGCEDKLVRVWYLPTAQNNNNSTQPLKSFAGHTAKVFNVRWSPLRDGWLCSGSDDGSVRVWDFTQDSCMMVLQGHTATISAGMGLYTRQLYDGVTKTQRPYEAFCRTQKSSTCSHITAISRLMKFLLSELQLTRLYSRSVRVWDYTQDSCMMVLQGHTAPVRGLLWNTEIPYLLISGSWDYTMRVWDVRDGACLDTVLDHGADVYGLTSHPDRPFVFASSSRDSTVRIWNLTPLLQSLELSLLANRPWDDFVASPEQPTSLGSPPLLCGKASKILKNSLDRMQDSRTESLHLFSQFFSSAVGSRNLWELVSVIQGMDGSGLSEQYDKGVMHIKHLLKYRGGKAQEIEMVRNKKFGGGGLGSKNRDERLREAAEQYLRLGNLQRYCDLLADLGEWDKALAVAPGVSMQYWQQLSQRRVDLLKKEESELIVPYAVAIGDVEDLVQHFTNLGQLQDAMTVATAGYEGYISAPRDLPTDSNGVQDGDEEASQLLMNTTRHLADWYLRSGCAVIAASCHLAVNDFQGCIAKLIRGNELELAASVSMVLGKTPELLHLVVQYLSRRCERLDKWELGIDLLRGIPNSELLRAQLCSRCAASGDEKNHLHQYAGLPSIEDCSAMGERETSDILRSVMFYIVSTEPETGLQIGLKFIKDKLSRSKWKVNDIWDLLQTMASIQTDKVLHTKCGPYRGELLILCSYIGALVALRRGYNSVVFPLFKNTIRLMKKTAESSLPLSESAITFEMETSIAYIEQQNSSQTSRQMSGEQQNVLEAMFKRAGKEPYPLDYGEDIVSSSNLPCHSDVHQSLFTGKRIQGPPFFLEDGRSAIAVSDALMWSKVNPFSPLATGIRINPF